MSVPCFRYLCAILFLACVVPLSASAVQITLDAGNAIHSRLDTFYVPVRLDEQNECVNAVMVSIAYDPSEITVRDVATGKSILTLWTQRPTVHKDGGGKEIGRVTFEGGIPGGYCGRVEGDPGLTNILAELVIGGVPKAEGMGVRTETHLHVEPTTYAFLHDGLGTRANTTYLGTTVTMEQQGGEPKNVWTDDLWNDRISPEYFEITLVEGPSVGNPRHYIVFSTLDKQSGLSHYEVLETDPDRFGFLSWALRKAHWVRAESPYVLRDQELQSKIMVKAVDKNGNERIATYVPPMSPLAEITQLSFVVPVLILVTFFVVLLSLFIAIRRKRTRAYDTFAHTGDHTV